MLGSILWALVTHLAENPQPPPFPHPSLPNTIRYPSLLRVRALRAGFHYAHWAGTAPTLPLDLSTMSRLRRINGKCHGILLSQWLTGEAGSHEHTRSVEGSFDQWETGKRKALEDKLWLLSPSVGWDAVFSMTSLEMSCIKKPAVFPWEAVAPSVIVHLMFAFLPNFRIYGDGWLF